MINEDFSGPSLAACLRELAQKAANPDLAPNNVQEVLRAMRALWRKFMLGNGLMQKRNASTLSGERLKKYRATNLAGVKRFYENHRHDILEKKRLKRLELKQIEQENRHGRSE